MNELMVIDERKVLGKDFRLYGTYEEPLFLAKEVAEWIEYSESNTAKMISTVDEQEKVRKIVTTLGGSQQAWFLTEDGLYEVLMQSRKPIAKQFKKEVKEILKTIRKHGAYLTPLKIEEVLLNPDTIIDLATQLKEERQKRERLAAEIDKKDQLIGELQPKADYTDYILSGAGTMAITQIAADYGLTANKLNKILHEEGLQRKAGGQWILYKEHSNMGYTKSETISFDRSDGRPDTKLFTKWTQKGRLKINEILNKRGIYANMDLIKTHTA